jgi:hypothetical protein
MPLFDSTLEGGDRLESGLGNASDLVTVKLREKVELLQHLLADKIRANLSGGILQARSGKLLGSVQELPIEINGQIVDGPVQVGGPDIPYGAVLEHGGKRSYDIVPVNKKYLAFMIDGKQIFTKLVHRTPLLARHYVGLAVAEVEPDAFSHFRSMDLSGK